MLWSIISNSFNLIEPFRLLARPEGASASVALLSFYQSKPSLLDCISAKSWALATVIFTSSAADILPALASESIYVSTNWTGCSNRKNDNTNNPCPRRIETQLVPIRAMQGVLAFASTILLWLLALLYFSKTGLTCDPRSIAAVAPLMCHDGLLHDFNEIPGQADSREMQRHLSHTQYRLGCFEADHNEVRYGVQPTTYCDSEDDMTSTHKYGLVHDYNEAPKHSNLHQQYNWFLDIVLVAVILGTFGVVLAYYLDGGNDGFNRFFNSDSFGPRFVLTLAATVIATLWKRAELGRWICLECVSEGLSLIFGSSNNSHGAIPAAC